MPVKRSSAFVLKSTKYGECDRIVTFYTKDFGKITGVAKGAAKSRKRFGGLLELLTEVLVSFEEKEGRALGRIDQCDLIESHVRSQEDISVYYAFSYMSELVDLFSSAGEMDERFYRLIKAIIRAIEEKIPLVLCLRYFELWTLKLQGILPEVQLCSSCGSDMSRSGGRFFASTGDFFCPRCSRSAPEGGMKMDARVIDFISSVLKRNIREVNGGFISRGESGKSLEAFIQGILTSFFERPVRSYRYLQECLKN